jgi:2,4-dienoyl-CoA reductase-like NADH-dependent reductase (Old Yellow Enzyme family)
MSMAAEPLELGPVTLRNRLVATAHASGLVQGGLPVAGDDAYWGRLAAGGAAMLIGGGTVTAQESSPRRGNIQEAWRPEIVEPWRRRVRAIHVEGGVAVCQLVHLGRETLGAETFWAPVAPSAVRSPREPTAPWAMLEREVDAFVEGFRVSSGRPTRWRRGSTESSCTPRTPTCWSSSCLRGPTAAATASRCCSG